MDFIFGKDDMTTFDHNHNDVVFGKDFVEFARKYNMGIISHEDFSLRFSNIMSHENTHNLLERTFNYMTSAKYDFLLLDFEDENFYKRCGEVYRSKEELIEWLKTYYQGHLGGKI